MDLKGKSGLITGATSGIGFATAKRALELGAEVIAITGHNEERLAKAKEELSAYGEVVAIRWRAEVVEDSRSLAVVLGDAFEALDFVFANAGVCWPAPLGLLEAEAVQEQFLVNVTAPMLLIQEIVPLMKNGGAIVLNTSCLNQLGMPGNASYAASKAALRSLARTFSAELMEKRIRVNALAPGAFETPIHDKYGLTSDQLDAVKKQVAGRVPAGRLGEVEEIVDAAVFLLSDSSRYMLGEEIAVDGGWTNL